MKLLIILGCYTLIAYSCKPVDHSKSEEKGLRSLLKKGVENVFKTGKLSDKFSANIKKLTKADDDVTEKRLKQILKKGGPKADEAALIYNRAYKDRLSEWRNELSLLINRLESTIEANGTIKLINRQSTDITNQFKELSEITKRKSYQLERILVGVDDFKMDMNSYNMIQQLVHGHSFSKLEAFEVVLESGEKTLKYPSYLASEIRYINTSKAITPGLSDSIKKSEEIIIESIEREDMILKNAESIFREKGVIVGRLPAPKTDDNIGRLPAPKTDDNIGRLPAPKNDDNIGRLPAPKTD